MTKEQTRFLFKQSRLSLKFCSPSGAIEYILSLLPPLPPKTVKNSAVHPSSESFPHHQKSLHQACKNLLIPPCDSGQIPVCHYNLNLEIGGEMNKRDKIHHIDISVQLAIATQIYLQVSSRELFNVQRFALDILLMQF